MRAFRVTWRAFVSFYNEMFLLIGLSILWWLLGGFMVGVAVVLGQGLLQLSGPWWLAPVLAIPAGPATAALAHVARNVARERHADRAVFFEGLRLYWRSALALNAVSMTILAILILNVLFYFSMPSPWLRGLGFLFVYLVLFWLSVQLYLYPMLVGLQKPTVAAALRLAATAAFANPLFSLVLLAIALLLTGISVILAILVVMAWPALMALLGDHAVKLFLELAGVKEAGDQ